MLPLLLKTKWRPWPDSQQLNWSHDLSVYYSTGLGLHDLVASCVYEWRVQCVDAEWRGSRRDRN